MSRFPGTKGRRAVMDSCNSPIIRRLSEFSRGRTATNSLDGECKMQHRGVAHSRQQSHASGPDIPLRSDPHPVDRHVGARVAMLRLRARLTQAQLAKGLGVSTHQLQKYESARNRISASMLYEISSFLDTPVAAFFEGLPGTAEGASNDELAHQPHRALLTTADGHRLGDGFLSMPPHIRRQVASFVAALGQEFSQMDAKR